MPSNNFALVVRSGQNEASIVGRGTKRDMVDSAEELAASSSGHFEYIGVTRGPFGEDKLGTEVHQAHFAQFEQEFADAHGVTVEEEAQLDEAHMVEELENETAIQDLAAGKLRLTIRGGKFRPIVIFKELIVDEQGNDVLVGHDVEYDKDRFTLVDSIVAVELKVGGKYVEVKLDA